MRPAIVPERARANLHISSSSMDSLCTSRLLPRSDNQLDKDEFSNLVQVEAENFMRVQKSKACVVM